MLSIKPTQITSSSIRTMTTNTSTWLTNLGCNIGPFGAASIVANSVNITIVGGAREYNQYWYSDAVSSQKARGLLAYYNPSGDLISAQILSLNNVDLGLTNIISSTSGEFVVGHTSSSILMAKFNLGGDLLWVKELSADNWRNYYYFATPMTFSTNNHYAIASTALYEDGAYCILVYNLDYDGNLIQTTSLKNDTWDDIAVNAITGGKDGNATIVGSLNYYSYYGPFITLFSNRGEILNSTQFFLNINDNDQDWWINTITPTTDQGYFAVGGMNDDRDCENAGCIVTLCLDSYGYPLSAMKLFINEAYYINIAAIALVINSNYAIVGSMKYNHNYACLIGLFDDASLPIWMTMITYSNDVICTGIASSKDGGFVITGYAQEKVYKYYYTERAITLNVNQAGFIADTNMPAGFSYYNVTAKFISQPVEVYGTELSWTVENQSVNVKDITSSISLSTYDEFCAESNINFQLLLIFLSMLVAAGLNRLGWQEEKRKVKAPWQEATTDDLTIQQKKLSIDSRKLSLSGGGLFGRQLQRFSRGSRVSSNAGNDLTMNPAHL